MSLSKERIFITGGRGFIGSYILLELSNHYPVVSLDYAETHPELEDLAPSSVKFIKADLNDPDSWEGFLKDCSAVFNFIGGGGNKRALKDPPAGYQAYVSGTRLLLEKSKKFGIKHIYLVSTIGVYPEQKGLLSEDTAPSPANFYSALKLVSEYILKESGLAGTIMRFSNIYGFTPLDPIQEGGALGNFLNSAIKGEDIVVYGKGDEAIDYLHIEDLKEMVLRLNKERINQKGVETFNIGSGKPMPVYKIAETVLDVARKMFDCPSRIKYKKIFSPSASGGNRQLSISNIVRLTDYTPQVSLHEGIEGMFRGYFNVSREEKGIGLLR